jgi:hypothetical protein
MTATGRTASASAPASAGGAPDERSQQVVQRRHRQRAADHGGEQQRDRVKAEQLRARHLQPEVERRLVDRQARGRLERADEERVPRRAHAAHRGVVERIQRRARERGHP